MSISLIMRQTNDYRAPTRSLIKKKLLTFVGSSLGKASTSREGNADGMMPPKASVGSAARMFETTSGAKEGTALGSPESASGRSSRMPVGRLLGTMLPSALVMALVGMAPRICDGRSVGTKPPNGSINATNQIIPSQPCLIHAVLSVSSSYLTVSQRHY